MFASPQSPKFMYPSPNPQCDTISRWGFLVGSVFGTELHSTIRVIPLPLSSCYPIILCLILVCLQPINVSQFWNPSVIPKFYLKSKLIQWKLIWLIWCSIAYFIWSLCFCKCHFLCLFYLLLSQEWTPYAHTASKFRSKVTSFRKMLWLFFFFLAR